MALTLLDCSKKDEVDMLSRIQESQPAKPVANAMGGGDGGLKGAVGGSGEDEREENMEGGDGGLHPQEQRQPCPLDFDLREIEGFRYRVEDGKFLVLYLLNHVYTDTTSFSKCSV